MLELLKVGLADRTYPIWIGQSLLSRLDEALEDTSFPKRVAVVCNPVVGELFVAQVLDVLARGGYECCRIEIPDGEEFKSLETLELLYGALIEQKFDRSCGLLALGGGVTGDLVGFAAATFMRGIPYVQVPTTLLAQVDSSVGGKTAVNLPAGKNLVGAFYQPKLVLIDVDTLRLLPRREFAAGMAEVIKYGIIEDADFFAWIESNVDALIALEPAALSFAIRRSCEIKAQIVAGDEYEAGNRAILNYGHTFGHAVEALCGYGTFKHGEAVAVGMIVAARLSSRLGFCELDDVRRIERLLERFGLPTRAPDFTSLQYLEVMGRDKKIMDGVLKYVLNIGIGKCTRRTVENLPAHLTEILSDLQLQPVT